MCGLCGVLGSTLSKDDIAAFQDLMIVSTIRGSDGAGIVAIDKQAGHAAHTLRSEGTAADLATGSEFFKLAKKNLSCLMGHARLPTSGNWEIGDVHPHVSGPVIGMHNGTMKTVNGKPVTTKDSDSRMLFTSIRNSGIDETVANSHGAYALTYINTQLDTISFLRNKMRPLCFARLEGAPEKIFWASESGFLRLVLGRIYTGKKITVLRANEDVLFTFRLHFSGDCNYLDTRIVKEKEPEPNPTQGTNGATAHTKPAQTRDMLDRDGKVLKMYETRYGHYVPEEDLLQILNITGCSWCGDHPSITEATVTKRVLWVDDNYFICQHCATHDPMARDYAQSCNCTLPPYAKDVPLVH